MKKRVSFKIKSPKVWVKTLINRRSGIITPKTKKDEKHKKKGEWYADEEV